MERKKKLHTKACNSLYQYQYISIFDLTKVAWTEPCMLWTDAERSIVCLDEISGGHDEVVITDNLQ